MKFCRRFLDKNPGRESREPGPGRQTARLIIIIVIAGVSALFAGCVTVPANGLRAEEDGDGMLSAVMACDDKLVHWPARGVGRDRPVLLLLHGATDDPTEMMDIVRAWRQRYDVYLYTYNYHSRVEKVGANLVQELKRLRSENRPVENATVIVYSYAAIVFREAVISADDRSLFEGMSLIQLVPTAGGSLVARWMALPIIGQLSGWASKPSAAGNPYGRLAAKLWDGDGNKKFCEVIRPDRTHTILVESDVHSLATVRGEKVRRRYLNGIGTNVVVIPKSAGATHEYLPTESAGLAYLEKTLERTAGYAETLEAQTAASDHGILINSRILGPGTEIFADPFADPAGQ